MFRWRAGSSSASTSAQEWIGASHDRRSAAARASAAVPPSVAASSIIGLRKRGQGRLVDQRIGRVLDQRAAVVGLEVEDAHAAGGGEGGDQRRVPVGGGVELELELGIERKPRHDGGARRDHEAHRPVGPAERLAERQAGLSQGKVERRALEGPAPVLATGGARRLAREQRLPGQPAQEPVQGAGPAQAELCRVAVVVGRVVGHVLAAPRLAPAVQDDLGGHPREAARHGALVARDLVAVDRQIELCQTFIVEARRTVADGAHEAAAHTCAAVIGRPGRRRRPAGAPRPTL